VSLDRERFACVVRVIIDRRIETCADGLSSPSGLPVTQMNEGQVLAIGLPTTGLMARRQYARQGVHLAGANPAPVDRSWAG
jgi:hypothetical protein